MKTFKLTIKRYETWSAEIEMEAESEEMARAAAQAVLDDEGWDALVDDDGDYEECHSEVKDCHYQRLLAAIELLESGECRS